MIAHRSLKYSCIIFRIGYNVTYAKKTYIIFIIKYNTAPLFMVAL